MSEYEISSSGVRYLRELAAKAQEEIRNIESGRIRATKLSQEEEIQRAILNELFDAREGSYEPSFGGMLRILWKRESLNIKEAEIKFNNVLYGLVKAGYVETTVEIPTQYSRENLYWYSADELKKVCKQRGLSTEGSKEALIHRLR